ncbi:Uncharacterised protein [Neisseria meningitidis]|nr:Uncharacterised protein [Neisseria meningitidis]
MTKGLSLNGIAQGHSGYHKPVSVGSPFRTICTVCGFVALS